MPSAYGLSHPPVSTATWEGRRSAREFISAVQDRETPGLLGFFKTISDIDYGASFELRISVLLRISNFEFRICLSTGAPTSLITASNTSSNEIAVVALTSKSRL